jgi:hypothetical protein
MARLLLDSAPGVDLRRSKKLPTEVLESIHAFLPRDRDARSPTAALVRRAERVLLHVLCTDCRRRGIPQFTEWMLTHGIYHVHELYECEYCFQEWRAAQARSHGRKAGDVYK